VKVQLYRLNNHLNLINFPEDVDENVVYCILCGIFAFVFIQFNYKQLSYFARLMTVLLAICTAYLFYEIGLKVYTVSHIKTHISQEREIDPTKHEDSPQTLYEYPLRAAAYPYFIDIFS